MIDSATTTAHIDESCVRLPNGGRVYGMAAVLSAPTIHPEITAALRSLLTPGRPFLHHYDETPQRRIAIAKAIAAFPLDARSSLLERQAIVTKSEPDAVCSPKCSRVFSTSSKWTTW